MVFVLEGECMADHIGVKKCWLVLIGVDFFGRTLFFIYLPKHFFFAGSPRKSPPGE